MQFRKGPSTANLKTLVPQTIFGNVFGTNRQWMGLWGSRGNVDRRLEQRASFHGRRDKLDIRWIGAHGRFGAMQVF